MVGTSLERVCCIPSFTQFHALLHAISCKFHAIFTQFGLFQPFLGQFQHVGYKKACTQAEKFNNDAFTRFQALPHTNSCNFQAILRNFSYFSHFCANFNMLGIKKHVLKLRNSMVIFSHTFLHYLMHFHAIFTQFWLFQPFLG